MEKKITEHPIVPQQKVAASVHQLGTEGRKEADRDNVANISAHR